MTEQIFLHTSDIRRFKQCRRQWNYASPWRYNKAPRRTPSYFQRGKVVHKGMEALYLNQGDPVEAATAAYIESVQRDVRRGATYEEGEAAEQLAIIAYLMESYPRWAKKRDDFTIFRSDRGPEVEQRYNVPLISFDHKNVEVLFTFRCDQIISRRTGLWIHDFKTVGSLPRDISFLDFDEQITGYLKGCEIQFQRPFVGAVFTYLLAQLPSEPEPLKNGGLSVNKKIYTTPEVYYRKLLELGRDPKEYKDFLKYLEVHCPWFARYEIIKTKAEKDILWAEHQQLAFEMLKEDVLLYKSATPMNCQLCSFKSPCLLESAGRDYERVLETEFVNAEEW